MLNSSEILDFLRKNKRHISEHYFCMRIGRFGSFARNEQTEESDIDILVQFRDDAPGLYEIEMALKEFLKVQFNRGIDICSEKWIRPVSQPLVTEEAVYA